MRFDDPDQEQPRLFCPNNVRVALPWPGLTVTAYGMKDRCGVFLSGRDDARNEAWANITPYLDEIVAALPEGTKVIGDAAGKKGIGTSRPHSDFADDDAERAWLIETLDAYVNALRPLLEKRQ